MMKQYEIFVDLPGILSVPPCQMVLKRAVPTSIYHSRGHGGELRIPDQLILPRRSSKITADLGSDSPIAMFR